MKTILLTVAICCSINAAAQELSPSMSNGKVIFQSNCVRCHGDDGKLGKFRAKDLQNSKLDDQRLYKIISNGKWLMPRWKKVLTPEQILSVIVYVKTLRYK